MGGGPGEREPGRSLGRVRVPRVPWAPHPAWPREAGFPGGVWDPEPPQGTEASLRTQGGDSHHRTD